MIIRLSFCTLILSSVLNCKLNTSTIGKGCILTITQIEKDIIGNNLSSLKQTNCFSIRDTIIEDEVSWPAKSYLYDNKLVFVAEANWVDKEKVNKVVIVSSLIESLNGIKVGDTVGSIRNFVSKNIPVLSDGYYALRDSFNSKVTYELNVSDNIDLIEGRTYDLDKVPDSIKVEAIIIIK